MRAIIPGYVGFAVWQFKFRNHQFSFTLKNRHFLLVFEERKVEDDIRMSLTELPKGGIPTSSVQSEID